MPDDGHLLKKVAACGLNVAGSAGAGARRLCRHGREQAFYVMFFSAVALLAVLKMRESAARPLLGSVPMVSSRDEAAALVKGQDTNAHRYGDLVPDLW